MLHYFHSFGSLVFWKTMRLRLKMATTSKFRLPNTLGLEVFGPEKNIQYLNHFWRRYLEG